MMTTEIVEERRRLDRLLAERLLAHMNVRQEKAALVLAEQRAADTESARVLVQEIAEQIQNDAVGKIASVVTHCLQSVFEENAYEFRIHFVKSRGKTEAQFQLVRGDLVLDDLLTEAGGGVCDIIAFALRLACLTLAVPRRRKVLVMDEPFKGLHGEGNRQRAADLIEVLATETGVQFIIATGLDWLRIGHVVEVGGEQ